MTEAEWLACAEPMIMLKLLREKLGDETLIHSEALSRKGRLFACACCRRVWHLLTTERSRRAVEVAERYADRQIGVGSLLVALVGSIFHGPHAPEHISSSVTGQVAFTRSMPLGDIACCAWKAADAASRARLDAPAEARNAELAAQAAPMRDIFGNPFRSSVDKPDWITPTVTNLAAAAYEERVLPSGEIDPARLAVLADALEETGCPDADILAHCRERGPHVRGCWAVDLVTGKA